MKFIRYLFYFFHVEKSLQILTCHWQFPKQKEQHRIGCRLRLDLDRIHFVLFKQFLILLLISLQGKFEINSNLRLIDQLKDERMCHQNEQITRM